MNISVNLRYLCKRNAIILFTTIILTAYYDTNSWNFTLLGKIDGVTKEEVKKILGKGNVTSVLSISK